MRLASPTNFPNKVVQQQLRKDVALSAKSVYIPPFAVRDDQRAMSGFRGNRFLASDILWSRARCVSPALVWAEQGSHTPR